MCSVSEDEPKVAVEELRRNREVESGRWLFGWRIQNLTERPINFLAARCTHGKFRSDERIFDPRLHATAGNNATIEMSVLCDEPAGTIVEKAFLILWGEWLDASWGLFVRFRGRLNHQ